MPRPAGLRVDHYELSAHLADGAQAEVHRATDLRTGGPVVVKFPHARVLDHPVLANRWRRELALTEVLDHAHLQCRRDVGERDTEPAVTGTLAGRDGLALVRLVGVVAGGFLALVGIVLVVSVALR